MKPRPLLLSLSPPLVQLLTLALQTIPSLLADLFLRVKGQTPKYMDMQQRAVLLRDIISKFTRTSLYMKSEKAQKLIATLDDKDKVLFPCDTRMISWRKYMPVFYHGVQEYLLKSKQ
ncbi:fatty acyl-CoA reductase 1-like [Melitaea cinxia]|uniref:fatty acyl-CoA reductase 1-like n=1 Tax=Melitaea cinxia TaxID=113334 RepID=UPI001E272C2A|nr:fatty acyl-CoA reductase 1-like [Melitaea cinxia]